MKTATAFLAGIILAHGAATAAETDRTHFTGSGRMPTGATPSPAAKPPFSAAVLAGNTLYISGATDSDPATGKPADTAERGAQLVIEAMKTKLDAAGMTMDDLVWVQIFCTDLTYYAKFNAVYQTYFKGPLPARAFLGVDHLLGGAHFEAMGIAVKPAK